jgi:hypothetical protein
MSLGALLSGFRDDVLATLALDLRRELPGPESLECHEDLRTCFNFGVLGLRKGDVEEAILSVEPVLNLFSAPSSDLCRRILVTARARQKLDLPESPLAPGLLTLDEVAALANMDLRSVRNATLATTSDRLVIGRHGTRTLVRAEDARRWLTRRRSFRRTKVVDDRPGLPPGGFPSRGALLAYLLDRQFERPLDAAHFGRLSELDGSVSLGDLIAAARTWGLDPCEFTTSAAAALSDEVR